MKRLDTSVIYQTLPLPLVLGGAITIPFSDTQVPHLIRPFFPHLILPKQEIAGIDVFNNCDCVFAYLPL